MINAGMKIQLKLDVSGNAHKKFRDEKSFEIEQAKKSARELLAFG
jgi:hypothetical protein